MGEVQFRETGPALSDADILAFEERFQAVLPSDYRHFLLTHNGGHPMPDSVKLVLNGQQVNWRLHFFLGLKDPMEECNLDWAIDITGDTRPDGLIPFATDEGGNFFYIDVRPQHSGAVYFGATPEDVSKVRPVLVSLSFSAFIDSLH